MSINHAEPPPGIALVIGTRPEAIKVAPVVTALSDESHMVPVVISTGQHRDLVTQMLGQFGITADIDLSVMAEAQGLGEMAARILERIAPVLLEHSPAALLVQGDTTTAMAAALAAFYQRIPVIHLEAGLRTGDRFSPYPEEVNRRLITQLASLHLAPTAAAASNLLAEGLAPESVIVTGNTVIDALFATLASRPAYGNDALERLDASSRRILLVTAHRRESWEGGLRRIAESLVELTHRLPELAIVFPVHPNPVVADAVMPLLFDEPQVLLTGPLEYGPFVRLMARSDLILTDSGGIQEEGPALGTPTLVTRETTERPEAIAAGGARLVGTDPHRIVREVTQLLSDRVAYDQMASSPSPFGDGHAAARVVAAIDQLVDRKERVKLNAAIA